MNLEDFAIKCNGRYHADRIKQWLYGRGYRAYEDNMPNLNGYRHLVYHCGAWATCGDSWSGLRDLIIVTPEELGL